MIPLTLLHAAIALENSPMVMKPRPKLKGSPLGSQYKLDKEGKIYHAGNPKASVSQKIAKRKRPRKKWSKAI